MTDRYVLLSVVAFVAYSLVAPLLKIAMYDIPSTTAVFLSNLVLLSIIGLLMLANGQSPTPYLTHHKMPYIFALGVLLAVALLTYYRALSLGPVSVVVPIYGLFIVFSSLIGVFVLGENVTTRKVAGIGFAVLAIVLISL